MPDGTTTEISATLCEAMARALYVHDHPGPEGDAAWEAAPQAGEPDPRDPYRGRAAALAAGPLADLDRAARERPAMVGELEVLRRQRMAPERERELLEANNRMLERLRVAEAARAEAEAVTVRARAERDAASEAEAFWQRFAFEADDLATGRLAELTRAQAASEEAALRERARRERVERALRLFADRAEALPKAGWASELAGTNRDIPLWWFQAARVALDHPLDHPIDANGDGA